MGTTFMFNVYRKKGFVETVSVMLFIILVLLPPCLGQFVSHVYPENVKHISLINRNISVIRDREFSRYRQLVYLSLAKNPVSDIPDSALAGTRLQTLLLTHTAITHLPPALLQVQDTLATLNIGSTPITHIDAEIMGSLRLRKLYMEDTALRRLTDPCNDTGGILAALRRLTSLTYIRLDVRHISIAPHIININPLLTKIYFMQPSSHTHHGQFKCEYLPDLSNVSERKNKLTLTIDKLECDMYCECVLPWRETNRQMETHVSSVRCDSWQLSMMQVNEYCRLKAFKATKSPPTWLKKVEAMPADCPQSAQPTSIPVTPALDAHTKHSFSDLSNTNGSAVGMVGLSGTTAYESGELHVTDVGTDIADAVHLTDSSWPSAAGTEPCFSHNFLILLGMLLTVEWANCLDN